MRARMQKPVQATKPSQAPKATRTQRVAFLALFTVMALILGYIESMIPLPIALPGFKLGLGNVAVLIALYLMGPRWAVAVMMMKVLVSTIFLGSPAMLAYSVAGSAFAFTGMLAAWRLGTMRLIAVSVVAAILHNVGQVSVAVIIMQTPALFIYLAPLTAAAIITGAITGTVADAVCKALPQMTTHVKSAKETERSKTLMETR